MLISTHDSYKTEDGARPDSLGVNRITAAGQTVLETAILIMVLVFALVAMQVYLKRGIQGRLRQGVDSIGEPYDPAATTSDFTVNHTSNTVTTTSSVTAEVSEPIMLLGGPIGYTISNRVVTTIASDTIYDNTDRSGWESVAAP